MKFWQFAVWHKNEKWILDFGVKFTGKIIEGINHAKILAWFVKNPEFWKYWIID